MLESVDDSPQDLRYERKFVFDDSYRQNAESLILLHHMHFREVYPPRWVNRIYLDTSDLMFCRANLDGWGRRQKFRIRWYGGLYGEVQSPVLEIKIKEGLAGCKSRHQLGPVNIRADISCGCLMDTLKNAELPESILESCLSFRPVILVRYLRRYFLSSDGRFRLTLDCHLEYFGFSVYGFSETLPTRHSVSILEIKYSCKDETSSEIAGIFPFRLSRQSKYVNGVSLLMPDRF
ncbi:MAG: VTC domain-containing protein [Planctomycetota bacterium]|nr:VTC domain-containing protein [Planctomycetota bacterium]